jgi:hypothetical protein
MQTGMTSMGVRFIFQEHTNKKSPRIALAFFFITEIQ